MLKLKGVYEWKLIDKDTGHVDQQGRQENLTTDAIQVVMGIYQYSTLDQNITLASIAPSIPSGLDPRQYGVVDTLIPLLDSQPGTVTVDPVLRQKSVAYNFPVPGSPRTIAVVGVDMYFRKAVNFGSYIVLSVPITQQITQYLYIKYTIFVSYSGGGNNVPNNRYVTKRLNDLLLYGDTWGSSAWFGSSSYNDSNLGIRCWITPFIDSANVDKIMRASAFKIYAFNAASAGIVNRLSVEMSKEFSTADIPGPLGAVMYYQSIFSSSSNYSFNSYLSRSPIIDNLPSKSRVFVHPASRIAQVFSDPSYPPFSQGTIALSGTPTPKYPVIGRIHVTKTGDASDIVEDGATNTFLPAAVNTGTNEITLAQSYTKDTPYADIVRFTNSGGSLPSGISAGTNYYVIQSGTTIKLSLSQGGPSITISNQGTGTHTILRQNTGEFSLELEPWYFATNDLMSFRQIVMGVDINGKQMPHHPIYYPSQGYYDDKSDANVTYMRSGWLIDGIAPIKDGNGQCATIYSTQRSMYDGIHNVCSWPFMSVETSQALCAFGSTSTVVSVVRVVSNRYVYIGTNEGIYKYDINSPSISPALLTITGNLIDSNIKDLTYDPITGYMWSGHTTGLSRIHLGTLVAAKYIRGTGEALDGGSVPLTADDVSIFEGSLSAYNGYVLRGKSPLWEGRNTVHNKVWILLDGTGWQSIPWQYGSDNNAVASAMRVSTAMTSTVEVIVRFVNHHFRYSLNITGKGVGIVTAIETYSVTNLDSYSMNYLFQTSDTTFEMCSYLGRWYEFYTTGSSPVGVSVLPNNLDSDAVQLDNMDRAFRDDPQLIDVGDGTFLKFRAPFYFFQLTLGYPSKYGWNGANWMQDNISSRHIPKTATPAILQGISVAFNNATGKNWDQQFIADERFTWVHAPYKIKDNLQTMQAKTKIYFCNSQVRTSKSFTIPVSAPYTLDIDERPDSGQPESEVDFRDMDTVDYVISVMNGIIPLTKFTPGSWLSFTTDYITDKLTVSENIPTGTPIEVWDQITTSYGVIGYLPIPLIQHGIYYAINVDSTHIRLATTYANAIHNTYINILANNTSTVYYRKIAPTTGTYYPGSTGVFVFSSADAGTALILSYPYSLYS